MIATVLLVSILIPGEVYNPAHARYPGGGYDVYQENVSRVAVVLCGAVTREYYNHLVSWITGFPHYNLYRRPGAPRTAIIVRNWRSFERNLPYGCEVVSSEEANSAYDETLRKASLILENLTKGTEDYEKLRPFFASAPSGGAREGNATRVEVMITGPRNVKVTEKPFLLVWVIVAALGILGLITSGRRRLYMAAFGIILILGAFFIGKALYFEHEASLHREAVEGLLSMKGSGETCWPVVGYVDVPRGGGNVDRALLLINETGSKILGVSFEDYVVRVRVGVNPENYGELARKARELGWQAEVEPRDSVLSFIAESRELYFRQREEVETLEKYLPELPGTERKAVERFVRVQEEGLKGTELNLNASGSCYAMDVVIPTDYGVLYYPALSSLLAKIALLVLGAVIIVNRARGGGKPN